MKRNFPLQTLKWQLTLSYITVIVVALPMLIGVGLAVVALTPRLPSAQQLVWILQKQTAPQIAQEMQHTSDRVALNKWFLNFTGDPAKMGWNVFEIVGVAIMDGNGQRIVPNDWQLFKPVGAILASKDGQNVVRAALANEQDLGHLTATFNNGQTIAAVPLFDAQQHLTGVFVAVVRGLKDSDSVPANPTFGFFWSFFKGDQRYDAVTLAALLRLLLLLIVVMCVIGVAFGMLVARRITRRLQSITAAVHAWSQGQFEIVVQDHSADEVGQLVRDLHQMTRQVQTLMTTQRQLVLLEERQRMARDLHDSVKQHTFAITLLIGAARKLVHKDLATAQTYLAEAEELAGQTRQELTGIIEELRPLALVDKGLGAALQEYVRSWSRRTGVSAEIVTQERMRPMTPELEETILRVTQESLANVARHSEAHQVQVRLAEEAGQWYLRIHDNGKGFDVAQVEGKGLGLSTMHERVEVQQGNIHVVSSQTAGTLVEVHIPFCHEERQIGTGI